MDPVLVFAGLGVGIVVGLTGMGGGALMTPILVLVFGVPPVAAVSSDLAASAVMKPFGGWVHARRGTVTWPLVGWLCAGSVPSAFLGVLLLRLLGDDKAVQGAIRTALAVALLLAAVGLVVKAYAGRRSAVRTAAPVRVRPLPTLALGACGGLVVGLTSVGSGSLIIVALLLIYPTLRANDLVGTDLVQAVPLVTAAALGHAFFGDLHLDIAGAVLVGSVPGVLLGARVSSRAPAGVVRAALVVVLTASALKLLDVSNVVVAVVAAVVVAGFGAAAMLGRRGPAAPPAALPTAALPTAALPTAALPTAALPTAGPVGAPTPIGAAVDGASAPCGADGPAASAPLR